MMLMTGREFKERFKIIQEEIPKIFLEARNENVFELATTLLSGDQERIDEIQNRMNADAQRRIAALSERTGVQIEFDEIEFNASEDFNIEVGMEAHFFEATPHDQIPA